MGEFQTFILALSPAHQLVTSWLYRAVRHPIHTGFSLIWFLG